MGSMLWLLFWLLGELLGSSDSALFIGSHCNCCGWCTSSLGLQPAQHWTASSHLPGTHAVMALVFLVCNHWVTTGDLSPSRGVAMEKVKALT